MQLSALLAAKNWFNLYKHPISAGKVFIKLLDTSKTVSCDSSASSSGKDNSLLC